MKFAMIPINRKIREDGGRIVRRVLISYKHKTHKGNYKGTKIVAVDPYFKNPKSSQQYLFEDNYFIHLTDAYNDSIQKEVILVKRPYMYDEGLLIENAIEFKAKNIQEAIELFNSREEVMING